jgi:DNA polymerase IV
MVAATTSGTQANFGKAGAYYYWISRGVDDREVRANRIRKSVGAENTFSRDVTEFDAMVAELQPLIDKVWRHCDDKGSRGRTFADFELITRSRTLAASIESRPDLESVTLDLLRLNSFRNTFEPLEIERMPRKEL